MARNIDKFISESLQLLIHCLITAPGVQTRIYIFSAPAPCLRVQYTSPLFTRSVHQPPTYKALTNQGGGALIYRLCSLL